MLAMEGMVGPEGVGQDRGDGGLTLELRTRVFPVPMNIVLRDAEAEEKEVWTWKGGGVECPLCESAVGAVEHAMSECEVFEGSERGGH